MNSPDPIEDEFCENGFIVVRQAVDLETVSECKRALEHELSSLGIDVRNPATWTRPVVRINCPGGPAFATAGTVPTLAAMYDRLLGQGRWVPRRAVGGTVPVRFPSEQNPGDAGWHIDGSYDVDGSWWVNVRSRYRGLLALFLFSEIDTLSAPTEILVGSHLDVPKVLLPHGDAGVSFGAVSKALPTSTFARPRAFATGQAGDVYLCHPFLVHRATWPHRGTAPRFMAQPEVAHREPFALEPGRPSCPVERSILAGLV